jgi:DNA (cytosine-5)-methyltransferase 1
MKKIKVASLFCGIGGFETGLIQAYGKQAVDVVFSSEIDAYTQEAYGHLYGEKPKGDIKKIAEKHVPDHDILVGGFPCQAFSQAGRRLGFKDMRGTLFFDIARIAKEKSPEWLFLENVKGLINHDKGRTLSVIIKTLSGLGYTVDFDVLNSADHGVPQNRERVFIVAKKGGEGSGWKVGRDKTSVNDAKRRLQKDESIRSFHFPFPQKEGRRIPLESVLEESVHEKYVMDKPFELLAGTPKEDGRLEQVAKLDIKGNDSIRRVYSPKGLCPTLTTMGGGHREPKILIDGRVRKLTPLECFRVQGFTDEQYHVLKEAGFSDSRLYKFVGNAVTPNVIKSIADIIARHSSW